MKKSIRAVALGTALALAGLTGCDQTAKVAEEHRRKGNELYKKEQWQAATAEFQLSLNADPKQEKLWQKKAMAHAKAKEMDAAVESLKKTLEFKTEPAEKSEVYRNIGNMFLQMGPIDRAEGYFLEALKVHPKDEAALSWLAEMFSQLGGARAQAAPPVPEHLEKAIAYYDQWIGMNPVATTAYLNKRIALIKYSDYWKAQKDRADADAIINKKDKVKVAEAQARAADAQAKFDDLKVKFEENNKGLAAAAKANPIQPPAQNAKK